MTQMQPPPFPPQAGQQGYPAAAYAPGAAPRWSAAAIGGFVLSILGFLGVTALLGLIFGIVGIFTTSGGRRRGRGYAIAAIPISVVTGVIFVFLCMAVLFIARAAKIPDKLKAVLGSDSLVVADSADLLREAGSPAFREEVSTEALQAWITQLIAKHGKLTAASLDFEQKTAVAPDGSMFLNFKSKFVNGPAEIRLTFQKKDLGSLRFDDIEIDGSSPRGR